MSSAVSISPEFHLTHTFVGHGRAVNFVSFSRDQSFLVSGGDDGILLIWNVSKGELHQTLSLAFHGPVSAAAWTYDGDCTMPSGLVVGSSSGMLHFYRRDHPKARFIFVTTELSSPDCEAVDEVVFDCHHSHVATAAMGHAIIWKLDLDGTLSKLHSTSRTEEHISAIFFFEEGSQLAICYLESHEILSIQVETLKTIWHHTLPKRIGSAVMLPNQTFASTNLMTGIDVFNFPPTQLLQTHSHSISHNLRLQLAALWEGQVLVVGSDDGRPRVIINRAKGSGIDSTLPHGSGPVQAVTASESDETSLVASAASDFPFEVKVWQVSNRTDYGGKGDASGTSSVGSSLSIRQLALVALLCCLVQVLTSRLPLHTILNSIGHLPGSHQQVSDGSHQQAPGGSLSAPQSWVAEVASRDPIELEVPPAGTSTKELDLWRGGSRNSEV